MAKRPLRFIDNLRLSGHEGLWQLAIEQGRIAHLVPQPEGQEWRSDVLDAQGGLALPAFVEPHIHRIPRKPPVSRHGTSPARCSRALSAGPNVKRC